jgi:DNA modification methylase
MVSSSSRFYGGDCLDILPSLPADTVQLIVTSPPYNVGWDYGDTGAGGASACGASPVACSTI